MTNHKNFAIITRDGIAVDSIDVGGELAYFRKRHSYSFSHAIEHEGYAVESRENVVRGWLAYLTITSRTGYDFDGALLRTVKEVHAYIVNREKMQDGFFSGRYLKSQLDAIEQGLNYLSGDASIVCGEISQWIEDTRSLYEISE